MAAANVAGTSHLCGSLPISNILESTTTPYGRHQQLCSCVHKDLTVTWHPSSTAHHSRQNMLLVPSLPSSIKESGFNQKKHLRLRAARCVLDEAPRPTEDSGFRERLLEPEAAGITSSGSFSISDKDFAKEGLRFNGPEDTVDLDQLNGLFAKVGFPQRKQSRLKIALQNTLAKVWLLDMEHDKLIAFARATGDAVFNATIWDVVVDPGWQKKGLGKAVIERLMADLLNRGITNINLYAEPNVVSFYKPLGFVTDPCGISGMALNKKKAPR